MVKRRIFISFDHDDTDQVNGFLGLRNILDDFEFYNHKLDREVQSNNIDYVKSVIREKYIRPASVCVVLIGNSTWISDWVSWEIKECLRQRMGILGIHLKDTNGRIPDGIPQGHVGDWQPEKFSGWIEWAYQNREKSNGGGAPTQQSCGACEAPPHKKGNRLIDPSLKRIYMPFIPTAELWGITIK